MHGVCGTWLCSTWSYICIVRSILTIYQPTNQYSMFTSHEHCAVTGRYLYKIIAARVKCGVEVVSCSRLNCPGLHMYLQ